MSQTPDQNRPMLPGELNGNSETAKLQLLIQALQNDCAKLRDSLSKVQQERDLYLKALYDHLRPTLHFEDVDIDELKKQSAGPVQTID